MDFPLSFYDMIFLEGVSYIQILELEMEQKVDKHATAYVKLRVDYFDGKEFVERAGVDTDIRIYKKKDGKEETLFCGVVYQASREVLPTDLTLALTLELRSTSYRLDTEKKTVYYRDTTMTYEQLMKKVANGNANIDFQITDKRIETGLYQNDETDWEFIRRLASRCKSTVVVNTTSKTPLLTIGIPRSRETETGFVGLGITDSGTYYAAVRSYLERGELMTTSEEGDITSFKQEPFYNTKSEGKALIGTVQKVEKEKVKVIFEDLGEEFSEDNNYWFEYATPYATGGGTYGSGFYFMPEVQDKVYVFLPSADESAAFAFGSVSVSPMENHTQARWRVPEGQEILFTEDGIRITCLEHSIYIDMNVTSEVGISVYSDRDINIEAAENVVIDGKNGVTFFAEDRIVIGSSETQIEMNKDKIVFQAEQLHIN